MTTRLEYTAKEIAAAEAWMAQKHWRCSKGHSLTTMADVHIRDYYVNGTPKFSCAHCKRASDARHASERKTSRVERAMVKSETRELALRSRLRQIATTTGSYPPFDKVDAALVEAARVNMILDLIDELGPETRAWRRIELQSQINRLKEVNVRA